MIQFILFLKRFLKKFEYDNNGIKTNYKGCIDSCVTDSVGRGPISDAIGLNLLSVQGKYYCCVTDNCNFSLKMTSNFVLTMGFLILSSCFGASI